MTTQSLRTLLAGVPGAPAWPPDAADVQVAGVVKDSRRVQPGFVFVAYRGVENDLHRFIPDALRRGAAAVVCENDDWRASGDSGCPCIVAPNARQAFAFLCAAWHGFPGRSMVMVGVTGTDGKTTTSNLAHSILAAAGIRAGLISTVNAVIGDRVLDTGLHTTTPDADEVQGYLAQMRDAGMTHCVLEVTSHGLAQYRVDGCHFDVAAVTNITAEHRDLHGTREAYRAAKARLFEMAGTAVLNADDAYSYNYLKAMPAQRRWVYSLRPPPAGRAGGADWVTAGRIAQEPGGLRLDVETPGGTLALSSPLVGEFNASNILAAVSVALALQLPGRAIQAGVAAMAGVPGRMERIDLGQPYTAIVDFAHTANALEQCLRTLRPMTAGRLIVVFGCAGERDPHKRPEMGRVAGRYADHVVLTAEDPRRESLEAILDQIEAGVGPSNARVHRVPDRAEAIRFACGLAQPGDIVVSCGKGHEQSMCFGATETPWDDRAAMRKGVKSGEK